MDSPTLAQGPVGSRLTVAPALLEPGQVVGERYRLLRLLGAGGMGQVFQAEDLRLEQPVALKFLRPSLKDDPVFYRRFLDEVRFARRVSHPHVCRVFDVGEAEGHLFLSMELIDGEDLATFLEERGHRPMAHPWGTARQICQGLAAIHDRGLLHRDLKPTNIMIDGAGQAHLTDFGLAVPAGSGQADGRPLGTLAYMAPERWVKEPASLRSDLYSLGLVLLEVFTGRRGYPRHDLVELKRYVAGEPGAQVQAVDLSLEGDLDARVARVVRWCLATLPQERPVSVEAVEAALFPELELVAGSYFKTVVAAEPWREDSRAQELLVTHGGAEVESPEGRVWLFDRPWAAVSFTLAWRRLLGPVADGLGLGVHLGEIALELGAAGGLEAGGPAIDTVRWLARAARSGQTLLSAHAFELARHHGVSDDSPKAVVWVSHGRFARSVGEEAWEIYEVGAEGSSPFRAPEPSVELRPVGEGAILGWRPAPGSEIPQRPGWRIERKLGEGGFGDVWLARCGETEARRVFKFCYDPARLKALQREITIFRLLREELGERKDITRVVGWSFDEAPFFIESEHTAGGSLLEWSEAQGGPSRIPLDLRLEIVAQVATALAAAHSVGVLHKDVKPGNILISSGPGGPVRAQLGDFGLGAVTDRDRLEAVGITGVGLSEDGAQVGSAAQAGTRLYLAPELLEGRAPSIESDIYALGVVLYQLIVGDLSRALGLGWHREIPDAILQQDVRAAVEGSPARRLSSAQVLAERLRSVAARRGRREAEEKARIDAERGRRQRRAMGIALAIFTALTLLGGASWWRIRREAQRAEDEAAAARQVSNFLVETLEDSNPFRGAGEASGSSPPDTLRLVGQAAHRLETELADQPEIRARLLNTLGRVQQRMGFYAPAQELFEKALALRRETLGDGDPAVAESLHDLAWLLHLEGDQDQAERLLRETLTLRRRTLGNEHAYVASALNDLAWVLQSKGDLATAEKLSREALAMKRRLLPAPDRSLAASLNHLAFVLQAQGRSREAEPLAREAVQMTKQLWGEHPDVAESMNNLARVLVATGDLEEAESLAREALRMRRSLLGEEHLAVAQSLHDLGSIRAARGAPSEAESLFEESLAHYRRLQGDGGPGVVMNLESLEELLRKEGGPPQPAGASQTPTAGAIDP